MLIFSIAPLAGLYGIKTMVIITLQIVSLLGQALIPLYASLNGDGRECFKKKVVSKKKSGIIQHRNRLS